MEYWTARELQHRQDLNASLAAAGMLCDVDRAAMRDLLRLARNQDAEERLSACEEWT